MATQNVIWTNTVGVSVSGNTITKNSGANNWGTSGASSTQSIAAGDGYMESTLVTGSDGGIFGLSKGDASQSYDDIDFGILLFSGGITIYEGGTSKATPAGGFTAGDVFRVAVESGVVKYRKNGTLLYTSLTSPAYPLLVDTAIYTNGAKVSNVVMAGPPSAAHPSMDGGMDEMSGGM